MLGETDEDTTLSRGEAEALDRGLAQWQRTGTWTLETTDNG